MAKIKPLSRKQKLFLQRLLATHVLASSEATELYNSILKMEAETFSQEEEEEETPEEEEDNMGRNVEECFGLINASLVPAFRLEIRTVTLPSSMGSSDDNEAADGGFQKYHAIVNLQSDSPAQKHAASTLGPHDIAFLRLAMEQIVEDDLEREQQRAEIQQQQSQNEAQDGGGEDENDNGDRRSSVGSTSSRRSSKRKKRSKAASLHQAPAGCTGALTRVDLLNVRTKLEGPHKDKLTIAQTERVIDRMIEEGWLVLGYAPAELDNNEDDDEDGENFENDGSARKKRRGRRSSPRKSSRGRSNRGGKRNHYWIGPRTYMECPDLLTDLGISKERMPQFIMHHA